MIWLESMAIRAGVRCGAPLSSPVTNPVISRLHGAADMSTQDTRRRTGTTARFRVTFAKEVMGLRFPVAFVDVRRARDPDRARRAAELRFSRRYGLDWRMRANVEEVEAV